MANPGSRDETSYLNMQILIEEELCMKITIDGYSIEIIPADRNLVDVADRAGIGIPAPCYRSRINTGCCQICAVEVDGSLEYACCTAPKDGMQVAVRRPDLMELRKQRAADYLEGDKRGNPCDCGCSGGSSCCS
jgi:NADH dehydrogenase/NADH:ubiquinone oxidoreductase subunit G